MAYWHQSKQGIRWPVSRGHIADSSLQLLEVNLEVTCFFEADRWLSAGFSYSIAGSCQVNLFRQGRISQQNRRDFLRILGKEKRGEREARVTRAGRSAIKSRLSPDHCSSCSGVHIWTRLPNWLHHVIPERFSISVDEAIRESLRLFPAITKKKCG